MRGLSPSVLNSSPLILFYDRASNNATLKFVFVLNPIQEAQTSRFHHRLGSSLGGFLFFFYCPLVCYNVPVTDNAFSENFTPPTKWRTMAQLYFKFELRILSHFLFSIYLISKNQINGMNRNQSDYRLCLYKPYNYINIVYFTWGQHMPHLHPVF